MRISKLVAGDGSVTTYERIDEKKSRWHITVKGPGTFSRIYRKQNGSVFQSARDAERVAREIVSLVQSGRFSLAGAGEIFSSRIRLLRPDASVQESWKEKIKDAPLKSAKKRAAAKGLEFSITREDIPIPSRCPALGIELRAPESGAGFESRRNSPSIDRIDSRLGYVPGNVAILSWRANSLKRDATADELRRLAEWSAFVDEIGSIPRGGVATESLGAKSETRSNVSVRNGK